MKKRFLLLCLVVISLWAKSVTNPTLLGLTNQGGINTSGTLVNYTGGNTSLTSYYSMPAGGCPGCGANPTGSLIKAGNGKMYGLSYTDGANYVGRLFQYDFPTNTYTSLVDFNVNTSGFNPEGSLLQASNGLLYGMTSNGGAHGYGTLFSYNIGDDSVIKLVDMPLANNSTRLNSLIQASNGKLYGMTAYDGTNHGGTIFEYDIAANIYTVKYIFPASANPYGDLIELGADTLYGLTKSDGTHSDGTIFRYIVSANNFTVLYNFDGTHGAHPESSLILATNGNLYGTTYSGGANSYGVLFSFNRYTLSYSDIHDFNGTAGGSYPEGSPFQASNGKIYGMTIGGGVNSFGTVYQYDIGTATFTSELAFDNIIGSYPYGHFIEYQTEIGITTQPMSQSTCAGNNVRFHTAGIYYTSVLWQVSTNGGLTYTNIAGATDTAYSLSATVNQNGNLYRAIFSNASASDTTFSALLSVYSASFDTITTAICPGQTYLVGSYIHSTSGTFRDTLSGASIHGCDSIVTLHLSVYNPSTNTITTSICPGQDYLIGSHIHSASGTYIDTLTAASVHGCDSIVTLHLTIYIQPVYSITAAICPGQNYVIGSHNHNSSGTYVDTLTAASFRGCDSIVTLHLTLYNPSTNTITSAICQGHNYVIGSHSHNTSGTFIDTLSAASVHGCDSVLTLHLTVYNPSLKNITASICQGQSYNVGNHSHNASGTYIDTISGATVHGCDSIVTLQLSVYSSVANTITTSICQGHSYVVGSHSHTTTGTFADTLPAASVHGCDSIVTLHLTVYSPSVNTITSAICPGQNFIVGSHSHTSSGTFIDTLSGANIHGCDSIVTLHLTVYGAAVNTITTSICQGQGYTIGGHTYTTTGTYRDTIIAASIHGCDSIVVLNLIETLITDTATVHGSTCTVTGSGATYQWVDCSTKELITGATSQTYVASRNGNYFCIVTLGNCTDTTKCVTVTGVGVNEIEAYHRFSIYPNPSSGSFTIEQKNVGAIYIQVTNILGEQLKSFSMNGLKQVFDISDLSSGVYQVQINDQKQVLRIMKLVKE